MELIIKAIKVNGLGDTESFSVKITEQKALLIKGNQRLEKAKIIKILKDLEIGGEIKSIFIPKNKKIQKELDELVNAKKEIEKSLSKIIELFRN